ncbi:ABC-three component system protein [Luteibacter sp. CQ10]|uniref:ABC-three component system protein n=1 Tax=Luteibacter sp. CQ10 TaxID=2805821 RepID=UPI0034A10338
MNSPRKTYGSATQIALVSQVGLRCPKCDRDIFYTKQSSKQKLYELAHIYPLNPTVDEFALLKDEERLSEDVNHPDNLIPLCTDCHTKFDKPRTVEGYRQLVGIKKTLIASDARTALHTQYQIESNIQLVISALFDENEPGRSVALQYHPKRVDDKIGASVPLIVRRKIKHNVTDYYGLIRGKFDEMEKESPHSSDLIYSQVRTYYLKLKSMKFPQSTIYEGMVEWIDAKTKPSAIEAAEIVAAYFVQNCEVFE